MTMRKWRVRPRFVAATLVVAALATSGRPALAQWSPNSWGWGGGWGYPGYGFGYGGGLVYGGMGMSLYDQELYKSQMVALNASRYNLENAQAEQAYSAANLYRQQAIATAMSTANEQAALQERYNVKTTKNVATEMQRAAYGARSDISGVLDNDGVVIWPRSAPRDADLESRRVAAEKAIAGALAEAQQHGKASVSTVTQAKDALAEYGRPALTRARTRGRNGANTFRDFLNGVSSALEGLALSTEPPPATNANP